MPVSDDKPLILPINNPAGQVAVPVEGLGSLGLFMSLVGVTGGIFNFEGSIDSTDGLNGNWFAVPGARSSLVSIEPQATLSATAPYSWLFNTVGLNYFRVRASGGTFGVATTIITTSENIPAAFIPAVGASGILVQGPVGIGGTLGGSPVVAGARVTLVNATARADGQVWPVTVDGQGKMITKPYSTNELDWQAFNANATPIITATVTTLKAAIATYRQYVTAIQLINTSATPGEIILQDATGTPVQLWHMWLPANMTTPVSFEFPTPLRTGSGTASAVNLNTLTGGMSIYWSVQGFIGY